MRRLFPSSRNISRLALALAAGGMLLAFPEMAFAEAKKTFGEMQQSIGDEALSVPKLLAVVSYAVGVFFAADGLLKLRAWMEESQKNPLNAALFRMGVAVLLIWLPHGMYVANTTLLGKAGGKNMPHVAPPKLGVFDKK